MIKFDLRCVKRKNNNYNNWRRIVHSLFWNPKNYIVVKQFLTIAALPGHSFILIVSVIINYIIYIASLITY